MSIYRGKNRRDFYLSSLLYDSIDDNNLSAVKILLCEKGADPNIVLPRKGISPFHLVIGCESKEFTVEVTKLILQNGGNPNVRSDDQLTPVHIAAAWGRLEILQLLLSCGGDPEARDANNFTPIHYTKKEDFVECLEILKSHSSINNNLIEQTKREGTFDLILDRILLFNGSTVGEYEILNDTSSIIKERNIQNLCNLPQSNPNEYVMNWFSKHLVDTGENAYIALPQNTGNISEEGFLSFESSVDESDNDDVKKRNLTNFTFRKAYKKKRKIGNENKPFVTSAELEMPSRTSELNLLSRGETDRIILSSLENKTKLLNLSATENEKAEYSSESGIVTLPNSKEKSVYQTKPYDNEITEDVNSDKDLVLKNLVNSEKNSKLLKVGSVEYNTFNYAKPHDVTSDYLTCSANSVLEKNIFEITEDVTDIMFTSDESKGIKSLVCCNSEQGAISNNDLSFISVSEIYKYEDKDMGIVLYERRLLRISNECSGSIKTGSSKMSSLPESIDYDTDTLRKELILLGYNPGPITSTTKRVYLKKLYHLRKYPASVNKPNEKPLKPVYSVELEKTLRDPNWTNDLSIYRNLEETVIKEFGNPDPSRKWREGINKSSFTYILLDPRVTNNLPYRAELLKPSEIWEIFLSAIFYVGKGKRARPYSHLYDAILLWKQGKYDSHSQKLQKILDIWKNNGGVICLQIFQNVIPVEAYTREAAMIGALKINNVTNVRAGDFYGIAATWPLKQKKLFGVFLLYKAMIIFLNEGERQLYPSDID